MTKIEWTNETWNPITGCSHASEGCQNCYAEKMHKRLTAMGQTKYSEPFCNVIFHPEELRREHRAGNRQKHNVMIFVNSMSDTFHKNISNGIINSILTHCSLWDENNIFQILTKRAERLPDFKYPENVWLGVTVEMAKYKNRMEYLKQTNAKVKFLSCEPLLEDLGELDLNGIDWVIVGGESGKNARPLHPDWVHNIQKQCKEQGVPFFFKQWGEWLPAYRNLMKNEPYFITITPDEKVEHQAVVKHMPFDFMKKNFKLYSWENGFSCMYSLKVGKRKAGALLDGKEYKQFPKCGGLRNAE